MDESAGDISITSQKLKWKIEDSNIAKELDTIGITNTGSDSLAIDILYLSDKVVDKIDAPKKLLAGEEGKVILNAVKSHVAEKIKGQSITLAFFGMDTTIVTIPIEIKD